MRNTQIFIKYAMKFKLGSKFCLTNHYKVALHSECIANTCIAHTCIRFYYIRHKLFYNNMNSLMYKNMYLNIQIFILNTIRLKHRIISDNGDQ